MTSTRPTNSSSNSQNTTNPSEEFIIFKVKTMHLQLKFSIPELISQGLNDKDKILVEILPEMFKEELKVNPTSKIA